ncbi:MAG: sulfatase-like hydrolase/transferase [Clostridia bacterium]|nr:sulfatase-like hydrolase/transferase [Clostridia bacterium]
MEITKEKRTKRRICYADIFYPLIFIGFTFVLNVLNALWLGMNIVPKYFLLELSIVFGLSLIIFLMPNQIAKKVTSYLFLTFIIVVNCINACVYMVFGDVFHLQMLFLLTETFSVLDISYFNIPAITIYVLVFILFIAINIFFTKYAKKEKIYFSIPKFKDTFCVFIAIIIATSSFFCISQQQIKSTVSADSIASVDVTNDNSLYENLLFKYNSLEKFGFFGFYTKELINLVFGSNLQITSSTKSNIYQTLLDNHNQNGSTVNQGILEGDNLICILTESLEWFAIDPIYTPTLYSMYENSVCLTNYYSKNKTNISEGIINFAGMPSSCIMPDSVNGIPISTPYSLASMFSNREYSSNYFHSFLDYFYNRNKIMPATGFENLYFANKTEMDYVTSSFTTICSDLMFFDAVKDQLIPNNGEKFFSAYATMSTHADYGYKKESLLNYYDLFENTEDFDLFSLYMIENYNVDLSLMSKNDVDLFLNYKVGAMDLDKTLEAILANLQEKNLQGNTTIVLYADHNCYGNDVGYIMKNINKRNIYDNETYRVPACIYSSKLPAQNIEEFTNPYDLNKTISILFNLDYNDAISNGYNIFDEEDIANSFFVSFTSGIFSDGYFTRDYEKIYNQSGEIIADENEIENFVAKINKFYTKQILVDKIYKYNILNHFTITINTDNTSVLIENT